MPKGPTLSERFAEINKQSASKDTRDKKSKPGVNKITNKPIVQYKPSGGGRGRDSERGTGRKNESGRVQTPTTRSRGPRLSRPAGRGRGGRRNGGEKKQKLTAEQLDKDLEEYKKQDAETFKASLDKELEEYSKQAAQSKKEEPAATAATEEKKE